MKQSLSMKLFLILGMLCPFADAHAAMIPHHAAILQPANLNQTILITLPTSTNLEMSQIELVTPEIHKHEQITNPWFQAYFNAVSSITKPVGNLIQKALEAIDPVCKKIIPIQGFGEHDVHFTTHNGNSVDCTLEGDFTLTCCPHQQPDRCSSFNILDNADPLHNCCMADDQGIIICSQELCTNGTATPGLCSNGQNNPIFFEESQTNDRLLAELLHTIKENFQIDGNTPLEENFFIHEKNIDFTKKIIALLEKSFNIPADHQVEKIEILQGKVENSMSGAHVTSPLHSLSIHAGILFNQHPLDVVLGHEIAHNYQYSKKCSDFSAKNCQRTSMPGAEIDADILGSLASLNFNSEAQLHMAAFFVYGKKNRESLTNTNLTSLLCTQDLPQINRQNVHLISNLLKGGHFLPHPDPLVRATMLLKLRTMLQAQLKYFFPNEYQVDKKSQKQLDNSDAALKEVIDSVITFAHTKQGGDNQEFGQAIMALSNLINIASSISPDHLKKTVELALEIAQKNIDSDQISELLIELIQNSDCYNKYSDKIIQTIEAFVSEERIYETAKILTKLDQKKLYLNCDSIQNKLSNFSDFAKLTIMSAMMLQDLIGIL